MKISLRRLRRFRDWCEIGHDNARAVMVDGSGKFDAAGFMAFALVAPEGELASIAYFTGGKLFIRRQRELRRRNLTERGPHGGE